MLTAVRRYMLRKVSQELAWTSVDRTLFGVSWGASPDSPGQCTCFPVAGWALCQRLFRLAPTVHPLQSSYAK